MNRIALVQAVEAGTNPSLNLRDSASRFQATDFSYFGSPQGFSLVFGAFPPLTVATAFRFALIRLRALRKAVALSAVLLLIPLIVVPLKVIVNGGSRDFLLALVILLTVSY